VIKFDTSCLPPKLISPSPVGLVSNLSRAAWKNRGYVPTTRAGEYAPRLIFRGRAAARPAKAMMAYLTILSKSWMRLGEETD
jgi:hypothetical protein